MTGAARVRLPLRAVPAWTAWVLALLVGTAWPWLALTAWVQRGGAYFWAFAVGCLLPVAATYLRFGDERAVRAVRGIRVPDPERERVLQAALAAQGLGDVLVWEGVLDDAAPLGLAAWGRRHVVVPVGVDAEPSALALAARDDYATGRPWVRPVSTFWRPTLRGPLDLAVGVGRRALRLRLQVDPRPDDGTGAELDGTRAVAPLESVLAFVGAPITGCVVAMATAAAVGADRFGVDPEGPWLTVTAYAILAGLVWLALLVQPRGWREFDVPGAVATPDAPRWKGSEDERVLRRNHAVVAGRRSLVNLFGPFASWFVASLWVLSVPLGLAERFGWVREATRPYQLVYLVLAVPAIALGVYAFRSAWGLRRGSPLVVLALGAVYVLVTGLTPLLLWVVARAGILDESSPVALGVWATALTTVLAVGLGGLARHVLGRLARRT